MKTNLQRRTIRDVASVQSEEFVIGRKVSPRRERKPVYQKYNPNVLPSAKAQVICVASGKGGTGKTTVTTNLAHLLAVNNMRVLLIDADMGLANAHLMMGLRPRSDISNLLSGEKSLEEVLVKGPGGLSLMPGGTGRSELSALEDDKLRYLASNFRQSENDWDIVLVDMSAGITPQVMRFLHPAHEIMLVVNSEVTSLMDAYALIKSYVQLYPKNLLTVRLVINRVRSNDEAVAAYQRLRRVVSKHLNGIRMSMWSYIPYDRFITEAIESKRPVSMLHPRANVSRCMIDLSKQIIVNHKRWKIAQSNGGADKSYFARLEQYAYE